METATDDPKKVLQVPLAGSPTNRGYSSAVDAKVVNCYAEKTVDGKIHVVKRPAIAYSGLREGAVGVANGIHPWDSTIYAVWGNDLWGMTGGPVTMAAGGFCSFNSTLGATPQLFITRRNAANTATLGYVYNTSGGLVQITDVDFPTNAVPGSAYINGFVYLLTSDGFIKGSAINDATSWDALNSIRVQIEPDRGVALAKQLVYAIALKEFSTEVFYDAGNTSGSPLAPVMGAKIDFGCAYARSVQRNGDTLVWIAKTQAGALCVVALENLKPRVISTPAIDRLLEKLETSATSWMTYEDGHQFYGINGDSEYSYVYDFSNGQWYLWQYVYEDGSVGGMPFAASATLSTYTVPAGSLLQSTIEYTEGRRLLYWIATKYSDIAETSGKYIRIPVVIVTPPFDGGTRLRKFLNRLTVLGDQLDGGVLTIQYTDDDYETWSTPVTVDLASELPVIMSQGTFKRRAYKLTFDGDKPLRLTALELQVELGAL